MRCLVPNLFHPPPPKNDKAGQGMCGPVWYSAGLVYKQPWFQFAYIPSIWEVEYEDQKFKVSLGFISLKFETLDTKLCKIGKNAKAGGPQSMPSNVQRQRVSAGFLGVLTWWCVFQMGCAEGPRLSENITVPDTKVNFNAWKRMEVSSIFSPS